MSKWGSPMGWLLFSSPLAWLYRAVSRVGVCRGQYLVGDLSLALGGLRS